MWPRGYHPHDSIQCRQLRKQEGSQAVAAGPDTTAFAQPADDLSHIRLHEVGCTVGISLWPWTNAKMIASGGNGHILVCNREGKMEIPV